MMDTFDVSAALEPFAKLDKDLKNAAKTLSPNEARFLVDSYYVIQAYRIRSSNQIRALSESAEPHELLRWMYGNTEGLEKNIQKALDAFSKNHPVGLWLRAVPGIGPVLASGLIAHIDITKAPYAGHIFSYAGLLPDVTWEKGQKRPWNADLKKLCVRPDQRILTMRGHLPIAEIQVGDYVLTHMGRWRKVTKVLTRTYNGNLVGLQAHGHANQIAWVTPNHPIYAKQTRQHEWEDTKRHQMRWRPATTSPDKLLTKGSDEVIEDMRTMREAGATLAQIAVKHGYSQSGVSLIVRGLNRPQPRTITEQEGWMQADEIKGGWKLFLPRCTEHKDSFSIEMNRERMLEDEKGMLIAEGRYSGKPHPLSHAIPSAILLDERTARLIGLYLAEGHATRNQIGFSFHEEETDYHQFVLQTMDEVFGLRGKPNHNKESHSIQIVFHSKCLAQTLSNFFGSNSYEMHLPASWLNASLDVLAAIVRGLYEGDGHWREGQISLGTVSSDLAYWVKDALHALGIRASICHTRNVYIVYALDHERFFHLILKEEMQGQDVSQDASFEETGRWIVARHSLQEHYQGDVFNLEVEEDHSYIVEGFAVHNCFLIGESFIKVQNNKRDLYGHVYAHRKHLEQEANELGMYTEQARAALQEKRYGKDTIAYQYYSQGMLPPAHIHARARRFAVKFFLQHLHHVWYEIEYGTEPPHPYVMEYLGHVSYVKPPFWPLSSNDEVAQEEEIVDVSVLDAVDEEEAVVTTATIAKPATLAVKIAKFKRVSQEIREKH